MKSISVGLSEQDHHQRRAVRGMGVLCDGRVFHRGQSPLHWSGYRPDTRRGLRALSNAVSCTRPGSERQMRALAEEKAG